MTIVGGSTLTIAGGTVLQTAGQELGAPGGGLRLREALQDRTITVRKAGAGHSVVCTLTNVAIASYQAGGSRNDQFPVESVTFEYGALVIRYTKQK